MFYFYSKRRSVCENVLQLVATGQECAGGRDGFRCECCGGGSAGPGLSDVRGSVCVGEVVNV